MDTKRLTLPYRLIVQGSLLAALLLTTCNAGAVTLSPDPRQSAIERTGDEPNMHKPSSVRIDVGAAQNLYPIEVRILRHDLVMPSGSHIAEHVYDPDSKLAIVTDNNDVGLIRLKHIGEPEAGQQDAVLLFEDHNRAVITGNPGNVAVRDAKIRAWREATFTAPAFRVHWILDASGSMAGEPMRTVQKVAAETMRRIPSNQLCRVTTFNNDVTVLSNSQTQCAQAAVGLETTPITAQGATFLFKALIESYEAALQHPSRYDVFIVVTDGVTGESDKVKARVQQIKKTLNGAETWVLWAERFDPTALDGVADKQLHGDIATTLRNHLHSFADETNGWRTLHIGPPLTNGRR